jgi:two-component sensor histidine kinase/CHASE3 domain sensor protein
LRSATTTILAITVVAVAILGAAWINAGAQKAANAVSHSIAIREGAERFLGHLRDAETGQRGFLLTSDEAYLVPYADGRSRALPELEALEDLVSADPSQRERVAQLRDITATKLAELESTVGLARTGRTAQAVAALRAGGGGAAMTALRSTVQQIQLAENLRLVELNRREAQRRLLASGGIVVALAALAFAAWLQLQTRQRRSRLLAVSNAELERIVTERTQELENERLRIEALLGDVSHRVGNNLAMVSALLNVQSRQASEPAVKAALAQAQSRIQAIAAGQRRLRLNLTTDEIDAQPYMEDLLAEIGRAADGRPITIELDMGAIRLPGKDAVSYVVIVNELVTNAIKHAFPAGLSGRILVTFRELAGDGQRERALMLSIEDDGIGLADGTDAKGLGHTVIASLLRSMQATMETAPVNPGAGRPGTRISLYFPQQA